jgi:hypothetical protein
MSVLLERAQPYNERVSGEHVNRKNVHEMSERRACRVIGCQRMTVRYRGRRRDDPKLREGWWR